MSLSPAKIFGRLNELKLWQQTHEKLLVRNSDRQTKNKRPVSANSTLSDDLSDRRSNKNRSCESWDRIPISPTRTFEEILEEKLSTYKEPVNVPRKPKQPFLKKGTGLARYRMKPNELAKYASGTIRPRVSTSSSAPPTSRGDEKGVAVEKTSSGADAKEGAHKKLTPLKMPPGYIKPKGKWCSVGKLEGELQNGNVRSSGDCGSDRSPRIEENINSAALSRVTKYNYEIIQQINAFTAKATEESKGEATNAETTKRTPENKGATNGDVTKSSPEYVPSEQTLYEKALETELLIFEALEKKIEHSSFCSTDTTLTRLLCSTPSKTPSLVAKLLNSNEAKETNSSIDTPSVCQTADTTPQVSRPATAVVKQIEKEAPRGSSTPLVGPDTDDEKVSSRQDSETWYTDVTHGDMSRTSVATTASSEDYSSDEESDSGRSVCSSSKFESALTVANSIKSDKSYRGMEAMKIEKKASSPCLNCEREIRNKISECEIELKSLQEEKDRIMSLQRKMDQEKREFMKDMKQRKREFEEQRKKYEMEIKEEKRKLSKEKYVIERYTKDAKNHPNRKEREEIANLKIEMAELKEIMKLKDTKNATCIARLRNQIKLLEKENSQLKEDVENMTKERAKLLAQQKFQRRPSETRMLHEINRNLTKLTKETFKNQNFKPDSSSNSDGDEMKIKSNESKETKIQATKEPVNYPELELIEKQYADVFGNENLSPVTPTTPHGGIGKTERILSDGSVEVTYTNGNVKTTSADGKMTTVKYYNGDIKTTNLFEGTIKYYYSSRDTWHTNFPDGTEVIEFPNGQSEKRYKDGKCVIFFTDGLIQTIYKDGTEEIKYPDGSKVVTTKDGERVLYLANGQKEIHTSDQKRREYPDGTVKILYADGTQETRYSNGRIRLRNPNGELIMDSQHVL